MSRLEIRLLGGFEAKLTDQPVQRFESQKARALLGYIALQRDQPHNRDHLAGLFWPERPNEVARRNLRQALYSIRSSLTDDSTSFSVLESDQDRIRLHSELDCWIDVEEFRRRVRRGLADGAVDPHQLTEAVRLYRGDLLAGFFLRGCVDFEEWLVGKQEQIREEALETFRTLVKVYLARGEHRFGTQYAKRLLAIDPLSEETHRQLMRLYVLAGRRNRALAQFEQLLNLLQAELGVEPVEETQELYRSILLQGAAGDASADEEETTPPIVPLIGRGYHFDLLQGLWTSVQEGGGRLTVVTGESGVGKSRLVKSFIDRATTRRDAVVLRGRSYAAAPLVAYRPIREAVRSVFSDLLADEPESVARLSSETMADLSLLCPEVAWLSSNGLQLEIDADLASPERAPESFLELLDVLLHPAPGETRPLIFFIEDLQWADKATLGLIQTVVENLGRRPVWLLSTSRGADALGDIVEGGEDSELRVPLGRLDQNEVHEIAKALVDLAAAPDLASHLWLASEGLPLAIAETINLLWDEKTLIQVGPGRWSLRQDPATLEAPVEIDELIHRRFSRLPNSSRRLISMAAVLGHQFDVEVVTAAGDEHLTVVETAIELSLERWLIRQFPRSWSHAGPERDIVLWARGARRGFFEFSHRAIRTSILDRINPLRRRLMHGEVARALLDLHPQDAEAVSEEVAFHLLEAGEAAKASPWLALSAEKAANAGAHAEATWYRERAERASGGGSGPAAAKSRKSRSRLVGLPRDESSQE